MFRAHRTILHFALIAFCVVSLMLASSSRAVTLAEKGKPQATIVHHGHTEQAAALQQYLQKMTGAKLPMTRSGAEGAVVELKLVDKVPGTSDTEKATQAYRLQADDGSLTLTASTELGLDYAVYGLLQDHLGVGFFAPDFETIPSSRTLSIDGLDELQEPSFLVRGLMLFPWGRDEATESWARKNRLYPPNGDSIVSSHTHGNYKWQQNCPLDEKYLDSLANTFKSKFKERDADAAPLQVGQRDYHIKFGGGPCEEAKKLIEKEGSYAAVLVKMLNEALNRAGEDYPEHDVITFAYFNTLKPPKSIKPEENLWINIVSSAYSGNAAGDQLNQIRNNPANAAYAEALRGWPKLAPGRVTTWHWGGNHPAMRYEWPNLFPVIDDIRFWKENGVNSAQWQIQNNAPHLGALKNWVWMQMAWDVEQDEEKVIKRFLRGYYGKKAAPVLWKYLQTADEIRRDAAYKPSVVRWRCWRSLMRQKLLTPDVLQRLDDIMQDAYDAAKEEKDSVYAEHVAEARARTVDEPIVDTARQRAGFGRVTMDDGSEWFVAGGRKDIVGRIERIKDTIRKHNKNKANRKIAWLLQRSGGRIEELQTEALAVDVVPGWQGRIISMEYKPAGAELLAGHGYEDLTNARDSYWKTVDGKNGGVSTLGRFNKSTWSWQIRADMYRDIRPAKDGSVEITRRAEFKRGWKTPFNVRWNLKAPRPSVTRVRVTGGGIDRTFTDGELVDLVSAKSLKLDPEADGPLVVEIDRGDGLVVRIETPLKEWKAVRFDPKRGRTRQDVKTEWTGDPQVAAGAMGGAARPGQYIWRAPGFWPWDRELFPVDQTPQVRLRLVGNRIKGSKGDEVHLPPQNLSVRTGAEKRSPRDVVEDATEQEQAKPVQLKIVGDGRAVNPRDGAELVWVPAGEFTRGNSEGGPEERPARSIHLDGYWIYKTEVTIGEYQKYLEDTGREKKIKVGRFPFQAAKPIKDEKQYPMISNWYEAQEYASWAGGHLPSEAQWEKAARGTDERIYPWGNEWDADKVARRNWSRRPLGIGMHPVGSAQAGASPYGALDMAGNVWEWVGDWYAPDYYKDSPAKNPMGPSSGAFKIVRGGDIHHAPITHRTTHRQPLPPHVNNWIQTGFRLVIDADKQGNPRE